MREKREKPTIDMCYHRDIKTGSPCVIPPMWKLKGEKHAFKVCDEHLAWGIRTSGFPALVDKHESSPKKEPRDEADDMPLGQKPSSD